MVFDFIAGTLLLFVVIALCAVHIPYKNADIAYRKRKTRDKKQCSRIII